MLASDTTLGDGFDPVDLRALRVAGVEVGPSVLEDGVSLEELSGEVFDDEGDEGEVSAGSELSEVWVVSNSSVSVDLDDMDQVSIIVAHVSLPSSVPAQVWRCALLMYFFTTSSLTRPVMRTL